MRLHARNGSWSLAAVALFPLAALAYRPFDSTDAAVAARGEIEVELGPAGYQRVARQHTLVAPALVVNWGIADRWEIVLEGKQLYLLDAGAVGPRYRLDDAGAFVKGVLRPGSLQEGSGPSIAWEGGVLLPSVNGAAGAGASALLIVSQRWPALTVHGNGSVRWTRAHDLGLFAGLIAEGPDEWPVRPVAEVFLEAERGQQTAASALAGAIWRVTQQLAADAAVRLARGPAAAEIRLGVTFAFSLGVPP